MAEEQKTNNMKKGPFKMKGIHFKQDQAPMKKVSPMKLDPITTTILSSVAGKLVGKIFGGGSNKKALKKRRELSKLEKE